MQDGLVGDLYLTIGLWMWDRGELVDDLQVFTKVLEGCVVELSVVVGDGHSKQVESIDDQLPRKVVSFSFNDPD